MTPPCLKCESANTTDHCFNVACDWVRCLDCKQLSWLRKAEA